jgi:hypothetical protein
LVVGVNLVGDLKPELRFELMLPPDIRTYRRRSVPSAYLSFLSIPATLHEPILPRWSTGS